MAKAKKEAVVETKAPVKHYCKTCNAGFSTYTEKADYCPKCKK